ncbi:palmitoyltransferase [Lithohypha guttulata]|uniref:Palmitoyltransferase n=1 Tax=Lithohypha guttulata TaxID=1690604 RepID=A0ABR0KFH0_9EURO|nr:palmitoyltransferase [Lithohypha guttulata]
MNWGTSAWTNWNNNASASASNTTDPPSTSDIKRPAPTTAPVKKGPKTVYYLGILRTAPNQQATELATEMDLSSSNWLTRTSYEEGLVFTAKTVAERTSPGTRHRVEEHAFDVHAYGTSLGFTAILITQSGYDKFAGQAVLSKVVDDFKSRFTPTEIKEKAPGTFNWPQLKTFRADAVNGELTGMSAVQAELDETKIVLHKTIADVLERGEKLDSLVAKSDELSGQSKMFYKTAKQQNGCCVLM